MKRNLRSYLAGLGSSSSLIAAAVAAFIALAAIVGFNGLPSSSGSSSDATVTVTSNAPEAAAIAAAAPGAAPAAAPAAGAVLAAAAATAPGIGVAPGSTPGTGGVPGTDQPAVPDVPVVPPPPVPSPPGDVATIVGEVDNSVSDAIGVDLGLADKTKPLSDALDNVIKGVTGIGGAGALHPRG